MEKTTVYLEEASLAALKELARAQGRAEAELIREAVRRYVAAAGRPPLRSLGVAHGPSDLAARTEDLLAEGFGKNVTTVPRARAPARRAKQDRARR